MPELVLSEYQAPENERREQLLGSKVEVCWRGAAKAGVDSRDMKQVLTLGYLVRKL